MAPKAAERVSFSSDSESVQILGSESSSSSSSSDTDTSDSKQLTSRRPRNANQDGAGPSVAPRPNPASIAPGSGLRAGTGRLGRKRRRSSSPSSAVPTNPPALTEANVVTNQLPNSSAARTSAAPGSQAAHVPPGVTAASVPPSAEQRRAGPDSRTLVSELIQRVRRDQETMPGNQQGQARQNIPATGEQPPAAHAAVEGRRPRAPAEVTQPAREGRRRAPWEFEFAVHRDNLPGRRPARFPQGGNAAGNREGGHLQERPAPRGIVPAAAQGQGVERPPNAGAPAPQAVDYPDRLQALARQAVREQQAMLPPGGDFHPWAAGPPQPPARNPFEGIHMLINERGRDRQQQLQAGAAGRQDVGIPVLAERIPNNDRPRGEMADFGFPEGLLLNNLIDDDIGQMMQFFDRDRNMQRADDFIVLGDLNQPRERAFNLRDRRRGLVDEPVRNHNAIAPLSPVCRVLSKFGIDYRVFRRASSEARLSDQDLLTLPDMPWDWALISKHKPSLQAETLLALQNKEWDYQALSRLAWSDEVILQLKDKNWDFKMLSMQPRSTELLFQTTDKGWDWHHLLSAMAFSPASKDSLHSLIRKSLLLSDEVNWNWNEGFINRNLKNAMLSVALREVTSKSKEPWDYARLSSAPWFPIDAIISVGMDKPWDMDALSARSDLTTDHLFDILPDASWNTEVTNRNPHVVKATRRRRELLRAKATIMNVACAPPRGRLYRRAIREFRKHQTDVAVQPMEQG